MNMIYYCWNWIRRNKLRIIFYAWIICLIILEDHRLLVAITYPVFAIIIVIINYILNWDVIKPTLQAYAWSLRERNSSNESNKKGEQITTHSKEMKNQTRRRRVKS